MSAERPRPVREQMMTVAVVALLVLTVTARAANGDPSAIITAGLGDLDLAPPGGTACHDVLDYSLAKCQKETKSGYAPSGTEVNCHYSLPH
jgi:hypothetical protein